MLNKITGYTGKHNFTGNTASVAVYAMSASRDGKSGKPLRVLLGHGVDTASGERFVFSGGVEATHGDYLREHGRWNAFEAHLLNGTIIGLHLRATVGSGLRSNAILLLRARSDADFIIVNCRIPANRKATFKGWIPALTGNFDIITPQEAIDDGVVITGADIRNYMDAEELDEDFDITVVRRGRQASKVKVYSARGASKEITVKRRARRVRIRRDKL